MESLLEFFYHLFRLYRNVFLIRLFYDIPDTLCSRRGGCRDTGIYIHYFDLA